MNEQTMPEGVNPKQEARTALHAALLYLTKTAQEAPVSAQTQAEIARAACEIYRTIYYPQGGKPVTTKERIAAAGGQEGRGTPGETVTEILARHGVMLFDGDKNPRKLEEILGEVAVALERGI